MHKILLVEDDEIIATSQTIIGTMGLEWSQFREFMDVLEILSESDPHLILMDIGLPLCAHHWCQEIRKVSKVPIMFLSSRDQAAGYCLSHQYGGTTLSVSL